MQEIIVLPHVLLQCQIYHHSPILPIEKNLKKLVLHCFCDNPFFIHFVSKHSVGTNDGFPMRVQNQHPHTISFKLIYLILHHFDPINISYCFCHLLGFDHWHKIDEHAKVVGRSVKSKNTLVNVSYGLRFKMITMKSMICIIIVDFFIIKE